MTVMVTGSSAGASEPSAQVERVVGAHWRRRCPAVVVDRGTAQVGVEHVLRR